MKFDLFVPDLALESSRCGRINAAFIATLEFGVFSTNKNSCWFSSSINWKPDLFLLRSLKRVFQSNFSYMSFILLSSSWSISFQGSEGTVVIAGGDGLCCVGQYVCLGCFR